MSEHRIRLRGGWECRGRVDDDSPEVVRRIDLPVVWPEDFPKVVYLTRQFGKPPVDRSKESVSLEFLNVPGLRSVRLNGREIRTESRSESGFAYPLEETILPRNGLMLEVERPQATGETSMFWGEIAIVIQPIASERLGDGPSDRYDG